MILLLSLKLVVVVAQGSEYIKAQNLDMQFYPALMGFN
jgi:hypothetical protein